MTNNKDSIQCLTLNEENMPFASMINDFSRITPILFGSKSLPQHNWINIEITLIVEEGIIKQLAKEIEEIIGNDKDTFSLVQGNITSIHRSDKPDIKRSNVTILPGGGLITPYFFSDQHEKIMSISAKLWDSYRNKKLQNMTLSEKIQFQTDKINIGEVGETKFYNVVHNIGFLRYSYHLSDRLTLERTAPKVATKIFGMKLKEYLLENPSLDTNINKEILEYMSQDEEDHLSIISRIARLVNKVFNKTEQEK